VNLQRGLGDGHLARNGLVGITPESGSAGWIVGRATAAACSCCWLVVHVHSFQPRSRPFNHRHQHHHRRHRVSVVSVIFVVSCVAIVTAARPLRLRSRRSEMKVKISGGKSVTPSMTNSRDLINVSHVATLTNTRWRPIETPTPCRSLMMMSQHSDAPRRIPMLERLDLSQCRIRNHR